VVGSEVGERRASGWSVKSELSSCLGPWSASRGSLFPCDQKHKNIGIHYMCYMRKVEPTQNSSQLTSKLRDSYMYVRHSNDLTMTANIKLLIPF